MPQDDRTELLYRIALTMAPAIGPVTARKLIKKAGSASAVFRQKKAILEKIEGIGPLILGSISSASLLPRAEKEMAFLERHHISALYYKDPAYPYRLKECDDSPILLYFKGSEGLNTKKALSVVGTRKASSYGKELCRNIVLDLSSRINELSIISGLAFGIDVIAHRAALEAGVPTVAVLGHGLTFLYPHAHRETARRISRQGALVTDFHSDMGPERNNFLRRNRIIAGMSDATLVVESAATGGALITADMASSYQRDVLAVPGRATDERSKGCNGLIKKNVAAMVESAKDVIDHLNWTDDIASNASPNSELISYTDQEKLLLELMAGHNGLRPEELSSFSDIPIPTILSLLTQMELKRWIRAEPGNLYQTMVKLS